MHARRWGKTSLWVAWLLFAWIAIENGFARNLAQFEEGNRLYEQQKYREAIAQYQAVLKSGHISPAVLFNLGNAFFKNGQLGEAIYNYLRAERIAPRDPDIQANLRFARDRLTGSASVQTPLWKHLAGYFTLNEITVAATLFFWACLLLLILLRWRPALRATLNAYLSFGIVFLAVSLLLLGLRFAIARESIAIAIQSQTAVHLGPLTESQTAFTVPDGTELRIENRRDNWLQVSDRSDRTGWVESSQVAVVP